MRVGVVYKFEAAHRLDLPYDSDCRELHGHSYRSEVEWEGDIGEHGMVEDFKQLKAVLVELNLDHSFLNDIVEQPTAENLANYIAKEIMHETPLKLIKVRVWETNGAYAEWRREEDGT